MCLMMSRPQTLNPVSWIVLLLLAWALLVGQHASLKTASGQNSIPETASGEFAPLKAAPRLAFGDAAKNNVSGDSVVAKGVVTGGGAKLENLGASEITRIQNAANRSGQEISVVGSRAGGTAKSTSDWDYVIDANAKTRNSLSRSLPGAGNTAEGIRPNLDVFKGRVDETRPFIRFFPE